MLFDTGIDDRWRDRWPRNLAEGYPVSQSFSLKDSLRKLGFYPDDIDLLIISHLHFDHAGNLRLFRDTKAGARVLVQEEEARHAFMCAGLYDSAENIYHGDGYVAHEFAGLDGIAYETVSGDVKLADDLELVLLPGHTPGTQGMVVRTRNTGTAVFPSDAVYNRFNYGPPAMKPGMCARPEEFVNSIEKVRGIIEAENGTLFYSHDVEYFRHFKKAPEWYD